ncbi:hypothetical protein C8Q78DRAFT_1186771 [Trametes maxima]|nr:hypothetical protein C8Q78DRAFT_1186771 [Trametes maxima]
MADASPDAPTVAVSDDHPLALELTSLRAAVARYQHEAHATSLKLQRHSLEASQALDHARALERENARLKQEVVVLRANPDTNPTQATFQIPELTLALRRLSDKLTSVEETLAARTEELIDTRSELAKAHNEIEIARALAEDARAREEEGLARERELERKLKAAEEERRMADLVVQEYAELVRKLEGRARGPSSSSSVSSVDLQRPGNGSTVTLVDSLSEGKLGLQRLLEEFNGQNERLEAEISKLHGDSALLYKELEVARLAAEHDRIELTKAFHELDIYRADDNTASKMVSRYMKFSQSSTDTLQKAMDALKARHTATLATINAELAQLQNSLEHERSESERLRFALDELTEDIAREAFGRRREVSLRLAFLGREENLAESLRRWTRRARESLERSSGDTGDGELDAMVLREVFARAVLDAEGLLELLNGQPSMEGKSPGGSIARLILAQDAVSALTHELQEETVRRLKTERKLARLETPDHPEIPAQQDNKLLVQPIPHRARGGNPEETLLADATPSSAPDASTPEILKNDSAPEVSTSPGPSVEEIMIVPPLDTSLQLPTMELPSDPTNAIPTSVEGSSQPDTSLDNTHDSPSAPTSTTIDQLLPNEVTTGVAEPTAVSAIMETPSAPAVDEVPSIQLPPVEAPSEPTPEPKPTPDPPVPVSFPKDAAERSHVPQAFPSLVAIRVGTPRELRAAVPPPLQLDTVDGLELSPLPIRPASPSAGNGDSSSFLVANLARVKHRYDSVQRGFRDCHLALKGLQKTLAELSAPSSGPPSDMHALLRKAVDRLGDFNEDPRVELEIRIADEERVASGYEALLSIPGALSHSDDAEKVDEGEMLKEVGAFIDGTDRTVAKAMQSFSQKLDDLEHDTASIKRTLHELALAPSEESLSATVSSARASPSWSAWTPSFLSPPRSSSPAPPTFGSVMTSPRLRHSSSFSHPRESSAESPTDPLAGLGLRIAVPTPIRSPAQGGLSPVSGGTQRAGPRQRTTSGMFMLGLGMRSTSFGSNLSLHTSASPSRVPSVSVGPAISTSTSRLANVSLRKEENSGDEDGVDSDVE